MKYILKESQLNYLLESIEYDPKIETIQKYLKSKNYNLGSFGPNKDGIDGKLGPLTRAAMEQEFGTKTKTNIGTTSGKLGEYDAILVGGLDNRPGDLNIDAQINLLKQGLGSDKNVKGFRYSTPTSTIIDTIKSNIGVPVYLFSAGCRKSNEIANALGKYKNRLFIIEPYAAGAETKNNVRNAVNSGVPATNVFVGDSVGRGKGIINSPSSSKSSSHWNALKTVASMTKIK